jgi:hypothetical protein
VVQADAKLPASYEDLPSSKNPQTSKLISSALEAALQAEARKYVSSRHRLAVYEAGSFYGVPKNLPDDVMPSAGFAFGYHPHLVVLKNR